MLEPYITEMLARLTYLWFIALLAATFVTIFQRFSVYRYGAIAVVLVLTLLMIPIRVERDRIAAAQMKPRVGICYTLGCLSGDDLIVLTALNGVYRNYIDAGGSTKHSQIPKILVPNAILHFGREHWIMPTGAARILPTVDTFPAAFFYFQGRDDYSYENYTERVCDDFDYRWLQERKIKYLLLPSDPYGACVKGLDTLVHRGNTIIRSGAARLIELY